MNNFSVGLPEASWLFMSSTCGSWYIFLLLLQAEQWDEFSQSSVYTSSSSHVLKSGFIHIFNLQLFFFLFCFFFLDYLSLQGFRWEPRWVAELFLSEDLHRAHSAVSVFTCIYPQPQSTVMSYLLVSLFYMMAIHILMPASQFKMATWQWVWFNTQFNWMWFKCLF